MYTIKSHNLYHIAAGIRLKNTDCKYCAIITIIAFNKSVHRPYKKTCWRKRQNFGPQKMLQVKTLMINSQRQLSNVFNNKLD